MARFNFSLTNRIAVITGAGRGIGKAIALAFADAGAHVVCADLDLDNLKQAASEIQSKGTRALAVPTDASKEGYR